MSLTPRSSKNSWTAARSTNGERTPSLRRREPPSGGVQGEVDALFVKAVRKFVGEHEIGGRLRISLRLGRVRPRRAAAVALLTTGLAYRTPSFGTIVRSCDPTRSIRREHPLLECECLFEATLKPLFVLELLEKDLHSVVDRLDRLVRVGHHAAVYRPHSSLTRQRPAHVNIGSSRCENHVLVILPFSPSASAKRVTGIRRRHCGLRASLLERGPPI